jgi:hypothetical protein
MSFAWLEERAYNTYSQFGEDGIIEAVFERIGIANNWCVECGASDGIFFSNTRQLIVNGWRAVLIESDKAAFRRLTENCAAFGGRVHCLCETVDAKNRLEPILAGCGAPADIDLAVIDVDGQDYYLFNSLLRYRPRVVIVEYDPHADSDFIPDLGGAGQAGLSALHRLAFGKFYTPVYQNFCNAVFVRQPLCRLLSSDSD